MTNFKIGDIIRRNDNNGWLRKVTCVDEDTQHYGLVVIKPEDEFGNSLNLGISYVDERYTLIGKQVYKFKVGDILQTVAYEKVKRKVVGFGNYGNYELKPINDEVSTSKLTLKKEYVERNYKLMEDEPYLFNGSKIEVGDKVVATPNIPAEYECYYGTVVRIDNDPKEDNQALLVDFCEFGKTFVHNNSVYKTTKVQTDGNFEGYVFVSEAIEDWEECGTNYIAKVNFDSECNDLHVYTKYPDGTDANIYVGSWEYDKVHVLHGYKEPQLEFTQPVTHTDKEFTTPEYQLGRIIIKKNLTVSQIETKQKRVNALCEQIEDIQKEVDKLTSNIDDLSVEVINYDAKITELLRGEEFE